MIEPTSSQTASCLDGAGPGNGAGPHPVPAHVTAPDLPRIGSLGIAGLALALVALLGALFWLRWAPRQRHEAQLVAEAEDVRHAKPIVEVGHPQPSNAGVELILPGAARSMQETAIYPRANGYLKRLLADIGDHVEANQLLAEIDAPDQDAELNQARAALEQAKANAAKAQVDMDLAQTTLQRYQELAKKDLVSQQEMDEKRSSFNQARATWLAANASIAASQAAIERLSSLQGFEKVTAPFAGTITARNYDVGALLSSSNTTAGREMFRIEQTDTLRIFVNVPQQYVTQIRTGQAAWFLVSSNYPGRQFPGKVARSASALDASTRTLAIQVDFPNPDHALYPGMFGRVKFQVKRDQPALTVPTSALVYGADGMTVAVVEDGKVHFRKISLGRDFGQQVEVAEGLSGQEQIITNPDERLAEGLDVQTANAVAQGSRPDPEPRAAAR